MIGHLLALFMAFVNPPDYVSPVVVIESTNGWRGSGVFITPTEVLTVKHVADSVVGKDVDTHTNPVVTLRTEDGNIYHEKVYVEDPDVDIAIITVDREYKGPLPKISCNAPKRGQGLVVVGNPGGDEFVQEVVYFTGGGPGKYAGDNTKDVFNGVDLFQGPAVGGLSGSPVYTATGEIIGVLDLQENDENGRTGFGGYVGLEHICQFVKNSLPKEI